MLEVALAEIEQQKGGLKSAAVPTRAADARSSDGSDAEVATRNSNLTPELTALRREIEISAAQVKGALAKELRYSQASNGRAVQDVLKEAETRTQADRAKHLSEADTVFRALIPIGKDQIRAVPDNAVFRTLLPELHGTPSIFAH